MLDPCTELRQHIVGDVSRQLRAEENADALGTNQFDGLLDLLQESLGRVGEQQVRLVEEEDELRLLDIPDLGQEGEQIGEHPHQERGEHHRTGRLVAELKQRNDAAALRVDPHQVLRPQFGLAEKGVGPFGFEVDQRAQDHPGRRRRHRAESLELRFALVAGEELDDRTQILEVEQR